MVNLFQFVFLLPILWHTINANQFFHISDLHYDPIANTTLYNSTTFCRNPNDLPVNWNELEDHWRIDYSPTNGYFGRYGCDAPFSLMESSIQAMVWANATPDFIIISGDLSPHKAPSFSIELEAVEKVTSLIQNYFPYTPAFIALGNNDFTADYNASCSSAELYALAKIWKNWIPEDQIEQFTYSGSYTASPVEGLRIIVFNSVLYSPKNTNYFSNTSDPCGQFAWIESLLQYAQLHDERVYLVSHIPPGQDTFSTRSLWKPQYISYFHSLVNQYGAIIPSMFFGHQHKDEFRLSSFDDEKAIPMLLAPSITPIYSNNPSFRIVDYHPNNFTLLNYHQYYMELLNSNLAGIANWQIEYNFTGAYNLDLIDAKSLKQLLNTLENDEIVFGEWFARWTVQYQPQLISLICNYKYSDPSQFANCVAQNSKWINKSEL